VFFFFFFLMLPVSLYSKSEFQCALTRHDATGSKLALQRYMYHQKCRYGGGPCSAWSPGSTMLTRFGAHPYSNYIDFFVAGFTEHVHDLPLNQYRTLHRDQNWREEECRQRQPALQDDE